MSFRQESDLLGTEDIPKDALYGVQSLRGFENFHISGIPMNHFPNFIKGFAITKKCAAEANYQLGLLTEEQYKAIIQACNEINEGQFHENFKSDMIQGGAGTTMNMNANEVIANRALKIMGHEYGEYKYCSPNDHINCSQSTNDAYPTAFHCGLYLENKNLVKALEDIIVSFEKKAVEYKDIIKMGRTQLQDGVPMTLGQTFQAYADGVKEELEHIRHSAEEFLTINMGATAIGTGICSQPGYTDKVIEAFKKETGHEFKLAKNLIFATSDTSPLVRYSSELRHLALKLCKICNDLRLLSSGPRCGLEEIHLPERQPGSSIMPGKVNPVIPEVVNQVCYKVIGNDTTVAFGSENAQLELNVMEPVMVFSVFESINLLTNALNTLREKCIDGIEANKENCEHFVKNSIGIVTALNPYIGYKHSTALAKEAMETGKSIIDLVLEKKILTKEELDIILKPENMIHPVKLDIHPHEEEKK